MPSPIESFIGRAPTADEAALQENQIKRLFEGVLRHPLIHTGAQDAATADLVSLDPRAGDLR